MRLWPRRRVFVDDLPRTHDARFLGVFLLIVVAVLAGVYTVGYVVAGDRVPSGTTVSGVAIGGMTRADAAALLQRRFAYQLDSAMTVEAGGQRIRFSPRQAGVTLDTDQTLEAAMHGAAWDPRHMLAVAGGGGAVDPRYRVDQVELVTALAPLSAQVARPPVDSRITVVGAKPVVHAGHPGRRLDVETAAAALVTGLTAERNSVALHLVAVPPAVELDAARAFATSRVAAALRAPIVVRVGQTPVRLVPRQFGPALRVSATGGALHLGIDPNALLARTRGVLARLPGRPIDARIVFRHGRPMVASSREGRTVVRGAWAGAVLKAAQTQHRRATAPMKPVRPSFTTADARALHIERLKAADSAQVTTRAAATLRVAARRLDATVVLPGGDFSLRQVLGSSSAVAGTSPLARVTQAAAARARMTITHRIGGGGPRSDLTFRNGSSFPIYVRSWIGVSGSRGASVVVQLWGSGSGG